MVRGGEHDEQVGGDARELALDLIGGVAERARGLRVPAE
jgi:hypothetical protein